MDAIFIPINVPSSKNSREIVSPRSRRIRVRGVEVPDGGVISARDFRGSRFSRKRVIPSKLVREYIKKTEMVWIEYRARFHKMIEGKRKPYHVKFTFVRNTEQKFDFINAAQIVQDLMVKYGWIEDDDYKNIVPGFNPNVRVDPYNSGVYITIVNE
jgi:hypothetical protein